MFERGSAVTDLLAPSFAIQPGDMIEGCSHDPDRIKSEWLEIDDMLNALSTKLIQVPGNHDVSNPLIRDIDGQPLSGGHPGGPHFLNVDGRR